jgi:hypothetical protein
MAPADNLLEQAEPLGGRVRGRPAAPVTSATLPASAGAADWAAALD